MTRNQKRKINDIFIGCDAKICNIFALDFINQEWADYEELQDALEDLDRDDLQKLFGDKVGAIVADNDCDTAYYLQKRGGVLFTAGIRLPENICFCEDGSFRSAFLSGYRRIIVVWGKDYDAAICKLAATCNILHNSEVKKAREAQGKQ